MRPQLIGYCPFERSNAERSACISAKLTASVMQKSTCGGFGMPSSFRRARSSRFRIRSRFRRCASVVEPCERLAMMSDVVCVCSMMTRIWLGHARHKHLYRRTRPANPTLMKAARHSRCRRPVFNSFGIKDSAPAQSREAGRQCDSVISRTSRLLPVRPAKRNLFARVCALKQ